MCLSYIMIQALMAAGNDWSQMKTSIEFNFGVSPHAQGSRGSTACKEQRRDVSSRRCSSGPRNEANGEETAWRARTLPPAETDSQA